MPTYRYKNRETGELISLTCTVAEMLKQEGNDDGIYRDEVFYFRDYQAEHSRQTASGCGAWPMKSDSAGVHPSQCQEFSENSAKMGVSTQFDSKTGQAIFTSRSHRAKYLKTRGLRDHDGGYGDG